MERHEGLKKGYGVAERKSMGKVLEGSALVVPVFQRRYCWSSDLVVAALEDAMGGEGEYSLGKVVFTPPAGEGGARLIIDGQQRSTSISAGWRL